jgi:HlyD family secretion protein
MGKFMKIMTIFRVAISVSLFISCRKAGNDRILLSGNIEAIPVEMSFRVAGKVLERPVDEGQAVQVGQLLARLDARDLEQQVALQEAAVATARAALAALVAGSRAEEIGSAKAALDQAVADLRRMEPEEARSQDLRAKGILSVRDYEATHAAFWAAQARAAQAEQQYLLVRKGPRSEDIDQSRARLRQAGEALALARTQLGYATLTAPTVGVVLSKNVEPNEYVAPGTSVLTLADLRQVWLRAYLEEADLGRIKLGQRVLLQTDTYPGRRYEGRVSFISSEAEFTPKSVQTRKERARLVYRIKVEVANPASELKPGMPSDAEILLGTGR